MWLRRNLSFKLAGRDVRYVSLPLILYCLSVLPLPYTTLDDLVRALLRLLQGGKAPMVRREVCYLYPSECDLGILDMKTRRDTLRLSFFDRISTHVDKNSSFWEEYAKTAKAGLRT